MFDACRSLSKEFQYAADRELLLDEHRKLSRQAFSVPAEVVHHVVRQQGYAIRETSKLDPGILACTDFENRIVWVALDFAERLDHPRAWRQVYVSTLAHELAHIRLHAALTDELAHQPEWETEAALYSQIFLVPEAQLKRRIEVTCMRRTQARAQSLLWSYVLRLADHFQVSGAFMVRTLAQYGLIDFDEQTRTIVPWHDEKPRVPLSAPVRQA